jgi:hypothetical protein
VRMPHARSPRRAKRTPSSARCARSACGASCRAMPCAASTVTPSPRRSDARSSGRPHQSGCLGGRQLGPSRCHRQARAFAQERRAVQPRSGAARHPR